MYGPVKKSQYITFRIYIGALYISSIPWRNEWKTTTCGESNGHIVMSACKRWRIHLVQTLQTSVSFMYL